MAELQEGLNSVAPMRGAGPSTYEEALEVSNREMTRKERRTTDALASFAEYLRMKIGKGDVTVEEIYRTFGTLFHEAVSR